MIKIFAINFLLAISTAMGMTLLPIVATENLGISLFVLGIIEGSTEFLSNLLRLVNGNLFDRAKSKKKLFIVPTGAAFAAKAILVIFLNKYSILFSKITERIANGAFASPRDAYVAKNATRTGLAFGVLNMSKTLGCVIGTFIISLSTLIIGKIQDNVFMLISISCGLTLTAFCISFSIKNNANQKESKVSIIEIKNTFCGLFPIYALVFAFFLARFNDGVLMMFLKSQGFPEWFYLSTVSFFNLSMFIVSPLLGFMIDKKQAKVVLLITILSLVLFNVAYYNIKLAPWFLACTGLILWGVQRTGAQIVFSYFVAQKAAKESIGTAIGILAAVSAFGTLISSIISGYLAQTSFFNTFAITGAISLFSMILVIRCLKTL